MAYRRALSVVAACAALAAVVAPASGAQPSKSPAAGSTSARVACKRTGRHLMRCTMTLRGGAGISGSVSMRITRGDLTMAVGHGRLTRGKATLTMKVLRRITPGSYTVRMVVTRATIKAKKVLRLR